MFKAELMGIIFLFLMMWGMARGTWIRLFLAEVFVCRTRGTNAAPLSDYHPRTRYLLGYLPRAY